MKHRHRRHRMDMDIDIRTIGELVPTSRTEVHPR
jgi:hypothetical protein